MDRKGGTWENIPDIRLLMEQLAGEWEEILEERFSLHSRPVRLPELPRFCRCPCSAPNYG